MYFFIKTLISALVIAAVTQLSEKSTVGAALLKSLPLTSFLVFFFMKYEGRTNQEISQMSWDILWLVIPSLVLFVVFSILLNRGQGFGVSLLLASVVMIAAYAITLKVLI
jgi:heme/copper-type cytochrome/quinol oxidase subunit 2